MGYARYYHPRKKPSGAYWKAIKRMSNRFVRFHHVQRTVYIHCSVDLERRKDLKRFISKYKYQFEINENLPV